MSRNRFMLNCLELSLIVAVDVSLPIYSNFWYVLMCCTSIYITIQRFILVALNWPFGGGRSAAAQETEQLPLWNQLLNREKRAAVSYKSISGSRIRDHFFFHDFSVGPMLFQGDEWMFNFVSWNRYHLSGFALFT